jgi:hypothetical protein
MSGHALIDDMGVANVGFLIENLGKDAGPLQYLRELVQNAFESILRKDGSVEGRVEIDFEKVDGVKKLRVTDNGVGMTAEEVRENINYLSASAGTQAFDKNFGIGAKITAAVRNPHGVMYKAWKDNVGSLTILGHHDGRYGRLGWRNDDGSVDYFLPLGKSEKHPVIADSGVSVVLLGKSKGDDTTLAPSGAELESQWAAAFLERRYFEIPSGIVLRVLRPAEIFDSGLGARRPMYDTIRGQHYYLDKHSSDRGRVRLPAVDANVYWWILIEDITAGGKTWNNRGHVACLYQQELYDVRGSTARTSALKDFGIYAGHSRVVIYVQPTNVLGANTARTDLILSGGISVDYAAIGAAFAEEMPDELSAFMSGQVSSDPSDHRKSILKNLKEVEEALSHARYRRSTQGKVERVEPEVGGRTAHVDRPSTPPEPRPVPPAPRPTDDATGRVGNQYLRKARDEMDRLRAKRVNSNPLPQIVWDEDGRTVPPGRAATYTHTIDVVTANAQFEFYLDLLEWSIDEAKSRLTTGMDDATVEKICCDEVRRWVAEALAQAVVVLRQKAHDALWGPMVYQTGLSDEGLTSAVVSHRWLLLSAIKRGLAGRLGRMKETVA